MGNDTFATKKIRLRIAELEAENAELRELVEKESIVGMLDVREKQGRRAGLREAVAIGNQFVLEEWQADFAAAIERAAEGE